MYEIAEILNTPESPAHEAIPLVFITGTRNSPELVAHLVVPPGDTDVESLGPKDYQVKNVILGRPTRDASRLMVTMGVKELMKNMGEDEMEIQALQRHVKILKGYLAEVVDPLDPKRPEETLNTFLREGGAVHLDPFLRAYQ